MITTSASVHFSGFQTIILGGVKRTYSTAAEWIHEAAEPQDGQCLALPFALP